jgi:outer membrane immunogenic protein
MLQMKKIFWVGMLLIACAGQAHAADLGRGKRVVTQPPPPLAAEIVYTPVYNWSGLYFGGHVGAAFGNVDHYYDRQNGKNDHGQVWLDSSGLSFSGHVGYNMMLPSLWVLGVEAELGYLGIANERIVIKDDDVLRQNTGVFGTLRGRVGYAFGRFMPYVTAGFAFVDIENAGGNPANANRFHTISEVRPGIAIGAGAEYAFSQNLVGRLEYLHINTANFEVRNLENEKMTFDNDFHLVRAGLSYKF